VFCQYLGVVFTHSTADSRAEIGETLSKLGKQKLADLDRTVQHAFRSDTNAIRCWDEIRSDAEITNPVFSNISHLFRKKRD
jgi:hypothetical protein